MSTPTTITRSSSVNLSSAYTSGSTYDSANVNSSYPVSNGAAGADSTTVAYIPLTQGSQAETFFYYTFASLSSLIPSSATINSVSASAKVSVNDSSSKRIRTATVQLCAGTTAQGTATNCKSTTVSTYNLTPGTWTTSQLRSTVRLLLYAQRGTSNTTNIYYFYFYGATLTVNYTFDGYNYEVTVDSMPIDIADGILATPTTQSIQEQSDASAINIINPWGHSLILKDNGTVQKNISNTTDTYTVTNVDEDHHITLEYTPAILTKENGQWLASNKIYKKTNNAWQEIDLTSMPNPFVSDSHYKALGNTLFDNTPPLMKMLSNLEVVTSCGIDTYNYYLPNGFHCAISRVNLNANQTFTGATSYVGELTPGEHYYVLLVSSGAHYDRYATGQVMGFFEIVYTDSTNITINKLFGRDYNNVSLGLEVADRTISYENCKALVPYSLYNDTKDYMFSVATLLFFKKGKNCKYSYSELNAMATDTDIFGVNSYRNSSSEDQALYPFRAYSPLSTVTANEWGMWIKNKKGYLWWFYQKYYSVSYLDCTNTDYVYCYPIGGNYPENVTLFYPNTSLQYAYNMDSVSGTPTGINFLGYTDSAIRGWGHFCFLIEET